MTEIEKIVNKYRALKLHEVIDYDKFNHYTIVHNSTSIEGSTLTENETRLLLDEGITPKGKPLEHSLMVKDHYDALIYKINNAKQKRKCSVDFIQKINGRVMRSTGKIYNTAFGQVDATKGEFRKGNVRAGSHYFMNYDKVEQHTKLLVDTILNKIAVAKTMKEQLDLSFNAHFDLVTIHPFYDGNGRTSRLLMNYIQEYYKLPLAIVYKEDRNEYISALQEATKKEDLTPFRDFMYKQYQKFILHEIQQYKLDLGTKVQKKPGKRKGLSLF